MVTWQTNSAIAILLVNSIARFLPNKWCILHQPIFDCLKEKPSLFQLMLYTITLTLGLLHWDTAHHDNIILHVVYIFISKFKKISRFPVPSPILYTVVFAIHNSLVLYKGYEYLPSLSGAASRVGSLQWFCLRISSVTSGRPSHNTWQSLPANKTHSLRHHASSES